MQNLCLDELWDRDDIPIRRKLERTLHRFLGYEKTHEYYKEHIEALQIRLPKYLVILHSLLFPMDAVRSVLFPFSYYDSTKNVWVRRAKRKTFGEKV